VVLELYGGRSCQYTAELREQLEWDGKTFAEYDVESDAQAFERLERMVDGRPMVPVLVEDGRVAAIGWHGRGCYVSKP